MQKDTTGNRGYLHSIRLAPLEFGIVGYFLLFFGLGLNAVPVCAQEGMGGTQETHFHLAPRPSVVRASAVQPITAEAMLDRLDGLCRFTVQWQDASGAVIDPFVHREFQYATPYFAFAVGTLVEAGRSRDLLPHGVAAMESATRQLGGGDAAVPDRHGEFFLASLSEALPVYKGLVQEETWLRWSNRLRLPIAEMIAEKQIGNWRTYAMKGEWQRAKLGLVSHSDAVSFIEENWKKDELGRFAAAPTFLYHDRSSDPDTLSVALVGEGNLLALVLEDYDGPSAAEIKAKVLAALRATVLLVDPTGQVPANGRTDDHVWTEVGLQLLFSAAAPMMRAEGDARTADAMERLAELSFAGMERWRRSDGRWSGSYYITKNHFDPALRVGYQNASQYSNYSGSLMFHLAEMYRLRSKLAIKPVSVPSPAEIGGYAVQLDPAFAASFANAGGLQLEFNLRGETKETNDNWWTPLGVVRIARAAWETRLGPSDGAQTASAAASFAPEIERNGEWVRLSAIPEAYEASWSVQMVNPAIVRCTMEYHPTAGHDGPSLRDRFAITPDGVLSTVEEIAQEHESWGVTWPLLVDDGQPLRTRIDGRIAETSFTAGADTESFLAVDGDATLDAKMKPVRSTFGDLLPVRMRIAGATSHTFVYPHDAGQPDADAVLKSFRITERGFVSALGRVEGDIYISPTFAGGRGSEVALKEGGRADLRFNRECGFVVQISHGAVTAIEVDRAVTARLRGHTYQLNAYRPLFLP
ncbi:hypothetical protein [Tunturibacter empetritectus]|nr:hypothetical protein [Edaphobacter lichenicola]